MKSLGRIPRKKSRIPLIGALSCCAILAVVAVLMLLPLMRTAVATSAAAPVVSSISPTSGPTSGGTTVTIKGNNFSGNATVYFGSKNPATVLTVSTKSITAISPAGSGTVDVTVTTSGGTSSKALQTNLPTCRRRW